MVERLNSSRTSVEDTEAFVVIFDAYSSLITVSQDGKYETPYEAKKYLTELKNQSGRKVYLIAQANSSVKEQLYGSQRD